MKNYKMKNILCGILLLFTMVNGFASTIEVNDSTGMLGDNFSLEGTLEIFKISSSPEDFEKRLNEEDVNVNNLDLNEDGEIDYIKVIDNVDGQNHAIVLQVDVTENESQDIAVIEMEKTSSDNVVIQIVGDVSLYGENMYVEPVFEKQKENNTTIVIKTTPVISSTVVNVWAWPSIRYIYGPRYRVWVSPWRWNYYPRYWRPWRPHTWRVFHGRRSHYHVHYHPVHIHRVHQAHRIYKPHRRNSVIVHNRSTRINLKRSKNKKVVKTKRKTTKVGLKKKNGRYVGKKKTTKTTTVRNKNNKVVKKKKTKTTTKVKRGKNGTKVKRTKTTTVKKKRRRR